jgi:hypothetical protein
LLAAGYAPIYRETGLDDPRMTQVRAAVEIILKSNEPCAIAHDRHWNAFVRFLTITLGKPPSGLTPLQVSKPPRLNVLYLVFDPNQVRGIMVNWEVIAKSLLNEAYRRLAWARDDTLKMLIADILSYPGGRGPLARTQPPSTARSDLPMELNLAGKIARMFSTVTTVTTPHDVMLRNSMLMPSIRPTLRQSCYSKPTSDTTQSWRLGSLRED